MGVGVVNEQLQRNTRYTNPCWTNLKGGCSHLCLPTSYSTYTCACPSNTGLVLARDATNCVVPNNFILSTSLDEGTIMLTSLDPGSPRTPVVLAQAHQPSAVDYDPIDQMVYWSDVGMNGIYRKPLNVSAPCIPSCPTPLLHPAALEYRYHIFMNRNSIEQINKHPN
uniref:Uncharacterized protein n=1 Tax=Ciona intestinalis TaxID=7719 RepID=H2Y1E0_CIOIN